MDINDFASNTSPAPSEPSYEVSQVASFAWESFVALTSKGFTEDQAMSLIKAMLTHTG